MLEGAIIGAIGGACVGLVLFVIGLLQKPKACPDCGEPLPKVQKAKNRRQMLWGGCTCPECGCEVDRKGRKVRE